MLHAARYDFLGDIERLFLENAWLYVLCQNTHQSHYKNHPVHSGFKKISNEENTIVVFEEFSTPPKTKI